MRKPVFGVSDQVRYKPGCTATENGQRFEISDLLSGLYYLCSENKGTDQLCGYREADRVFVFAYAKSRFSHDEALMTQPTPSAKKKIASNR